MTIEDLEAKRLRVRKGIWNTIMAIVVIDALLVLRMLGVL